MKSCRFRVSSFSKKVLTNSIAGSIIVSNFDLSVDLQCLYAISSTPFSLKYSKTFACNVLDPGHCSQLSSCKLEEMDYVLSRQKHWHSGSK